MIVVTSLSPVHSNWESQIDSVKSWKAFGEVYSLNTSIEIDQMRLIYENDVCFVKTDKTIKHLVGKPLVSINAMIDFAILNESDLLLINSDIVINNLPELKQEGVTIISRYDYSEHFGDAKIFNSGFDLMYIPKKYLGIFPPSVFGMGAAWWDVWLPYTVLLNKISVYWPQGKFIFHKLHPTQYNYEEWIYISEYFKWWFKIDRTLNAGQVATKYVNEIKSKAIKY